MAASDVALAEGLLKEADDEQVRMMEERVILVDHNDKAIGSGSKKETHIWSNINAGMLHRAFSVFLFTPEGKLILQQRSGVKITFPYIWANTCCSHPLSVPSELIEEEAMGVKNAARRKLEHELGIPPEDVPLESFTWLTRVHYVGASEPGDGSEPVWGEHEIDWILMCTPPATPRMALNENEVEATRAFTQAELREWMATRHSRGEEVSPWFGVMEASGLIYKWWDAVLARNLPPVFERGVIHRQHDLEALARGVPASKVPVQPAIAASARLAAEAAAAPVSRGGAGAAAASGSSSSSAAGHLKASSVDAASAAGAASAASSSGARKTGAAAAGAGAASGAVATPSSAAVIPGATASTPKQGAYGKVRIHSESLLSQLSHLDEVAAAAAFKLGWTSATKVKPLSPTATESEVYCERMLCKVSRSFAMVIQQLPDHLRTAVCVFYLVLRGLDTVEDDMEAFKGAQEDKLRHLRAFHAYLTDPAFAMDGVGEGDERSLLQSFYHVNRVFIGLPAGDREVIADICARMGEGMAQFSGRDLREGTTDAADYGLYCHYVAGLVGEGLSRLFVAHGDEDAIVAQDVKLADDMGRFLQKTNIIRDYLEDLVEGRAFWPREIWGRYAPGLANLRAKVDAYQNQTRGGGVATEDAAAQEDQARACLNHLVADAMTLAPSCLRYMARLRQPDVFRFCAIPQVMAIATLDKLTNNADVFTGVVKIRKGQALQLMNNAGSMRNLHATFLKHARSIRAKVPAHHTAARGLLEGAVADLERTCLEGLNRGGPTTGGLVARTLFSTPASVVVALLLAYLLQHLYKRSRAWDAFLPRITDSWDVAALALAVSCALFLLVFGGVPVVQSLSSPAEISASPKAADGGRGSAFGASLPSEGDLAVKGAGAGAGSAAVSRGGVAAAGSR